MLAIVNWLFFFLFWQLVLWTVFLPLPSVALVVTFVLARRIRRLRLAALAATATGFGILAGIVMVGMFGGETSASPWADFAFIMGGYGLTFLPAAYFTGRLAVKTGLEADAANMRRQQAGSSDAMAPDGGQSSGGLR